MRVTLKELRKQKKLTQVECASYLDIPIRTYQNYENEEKKRKTLKYQYMMEKLERYGYIDEGHGILTIAKIEEICRKVFASYDVEYCYLFGSYAKRKAKPESDVDLLISTDISGIKFYDLAESLREALNKKVDLLKLEQLKDNPELLNEILRDGIKIYG